MEIKKIMLTYAAAIVSAFLFFAAVEAADYFLKNKAGKRNAKQALLTILSGAGLRLFAEAERLYGTKTGDVKMSYVTERILALMPRETRAFIDVGSLRAAAERGFEQAKQNEAYLRATERGSIHNA